MKIAKYVGDLLYDYECVVIPGLGGFITNDSSVSINEVTHNFTPPFRNIHFNIHLRANDGLLVNHVAQKEQIGYKTAKQRVDQFAFKCHNALNKGKKINFKNIGSIYYDVDKNIVFAQDKKTNYNPDSFGLSSLVSPAIRRVTDEQKIKNVVKSAINIKSTIKKPTDRKGIVNGKILLSSNKRMRATKRKSSFTNQLVFLMVVIFIFGGGYLYMHKNDLDHYIKNNASNFPLFYSSVNDYLTININSTHVAKLSSSAASFLPAFINTENSSVLTEKNRLDDNNTEITDNIGDIKIPDVVYVQPTTTVANNKVGEIKNKTENNHLNKEVEINSAIVNIPSDNYNIVSESVDAKKYYLIAGSFSNESNAISLVKNLKNKGFDALIADTNKYGMYRVAFMLINNRALAQNKLLAIRNEFNQDAWLLTK